MGPATYMETLIAALGEPRGPTLVMFFVQRFSIGKGGVAQVSVALCLLNEVRFVGSDHRV